MLTISRPRRLKQAGRTVIAVAVHHSVLSPGEAATVTYSTRSTEGCNALLHGGASTRFLAHLEGDESQECELDVTAAASKPQTITVPIRFSPAAEFVKTPFESSPAPDDALAKWERFGEERKLCLAILEVVWELAKDEGSKRTDGQVARLLHPKGFTLERSTVNNRITKLIPTFLTRNRGLSVTGAGRLVLERYSTGFQP